MNGKIVIAGNSIEELERELATVKALMAMGKTYGVGGKSVDEIEKGMNMVGATPSCCPCNCNCECEDEEDDELTFGDEYEVLDEDEDYIQLYDHEADCYCYYNKKTEDFEYPVNEEDEDEDISELITDIIDKVKDLEDIIKR
jgi:hypothetical protein